VRRARSAVSPHGGIPPQHPGAWIAHRAGPPGGRCPSSEHHGAATARRAWTRSPPSGATRAGSYGDTAATVLSTPAAAGVNRAGTWVPRGFRGNRGPYRHAAYPDIRLGRYRGHPPRDLEDLEVLEPVLAGRSGGSRTCTRTRRGSERSVGCGGGTPGGEPTSSSSERRSAPLRRPGLRDPSPPQRWEHRRCAFPAAHAIRPASALGARRWRDPSPCR